MLMTRRRGDHRPVTFSSAVDTYIKQTGRPRATRRRPRSRSTATPAPPYQTLLAFTGLFGDGPGQVPLGATITSAMVTLNTTNGSGSGASLYRMTSAGPTAAAGRRSATASSPGPRPPPPPTSSSIRSKRPRQLRRDEQRRRLARRRRHRRRRQPRQQGLGVPRQRHRRLGFLVDRQRRQAAADRQLHPPRRPGPRRAHDGRPHPRRRHPRQHPAPTPATAPAPTGSQPPTTTGPPRTSPPTPCGTSPAFTRRRASRRA